MSMYWPEHGVAVEIVDDKASPAFDREAHPDVTVLALTTDQIRDPKAFDAFAHRLAHHLGCTIPPDTEQTRAARAALRAQLFGSSAPQNR